MAADDNLVQEMDGRAHKQADPVRSGPDGRTDGRTAQDAKSYFDHHFAHSFHDCGSRRGRREVTAVRTAVSWSRLASASLLSQPSRNQAVRTKVPGQESRFPCPPIAPLGRACKVLHGSSNPSSVDEESDSESIGASLISPSYRLRTTNLLYTLVQLYVQAFVQILGQTTLGHVLGGMDMTSFAFSHLLLATLAGID
jgi:hypothetical protein